MCKRISRLAVIVLVSAAPLAQAQQKAPAPSQAPSRAPSQAAGSPVPASSPLPGNKVAAISDLERQIVTRLISFSDDQVAIGRQAQEKASIPDVKHFAGEIVQRHGALLSRLKALTGSNSPSSSPATQAATSPPTATSPPAASPPPSNPATDRRDAAPEFVRLNDEASRGFQRSLRLELSSKQGSQYDVEFLYSQVSAQLWMLEALTVFERHASGELKLVLQRQIQVAQFDLNQAKGLMARIRELGAERAAVGGIFGPKPGTPGVGTTFRGGGSVPRSRGGLSPLPTRITSPSSPTVGPARGSP